MKNSIYCTFDHIFKGNKTLTTWTNLSLFLCHYQSFKSRSVTEIKAATKRFWCLLLPFFTVFIWWNKITPKRWYGRDETPIQPQRNAIWPRQNANRYRLPFFPIKMNKNHIFSTTMNINYKVISFFNSFLVQNYTFISHLIIRFVRYCD
jgi:hypothetical protein